VPRWFIRYHSVLVKCRGIGQNRTLKNSVKHAQEVPCIEEKTFLVKSSAPSLVFKESDSFIFEYLNTSKKLQWVKYSFSSHIFSFSFVVIQNEFNQVDDFPSLQSVCVCAHTPMRAFARVWVVNDPKTPKVLN
jgi:hypothetical protein